MVTHIKVTQHDHWPHKHMKEPLLHLWPGELYVLESCRATFLAPDLIIPRNILPRPGPNLKTQGLGCPADLCLCSTPCTHKLLHVCTIIAFYYFKSISDTNMTSEHNHHLSTSFDEHRISESTHCNAQHFQSVIQTASTSHTPEKRWLLWIFMSQIIWNNSSCGIFCYPGSTLLGYDLMCSYLPLDVL